MNRAVNAKRENYAAARLALPEGGRHFLLSVQSTLTRCRGAICDLDYGRQSGFCGIYSVMSALDEMLYSSGGEMTNARLPEGFSMKCVKSCSIHVRYCERGTWQGDVRFGEKLLHFGDENQLMQILKSIIFEL